MPRRCATVSRTSSTTMTPSDPAPLQDAAAAGAAPAERRLHPWSWLFVLLQQLKQFVVPLVAAFFFGGDRNELWPLIGVGVLTFASVMQYVTYRYVVGRDALAIRSGWLHRQRREIPYARIHNVSVEQSLLHRVFGVAELRLESAGGQKPEAQMRVLRLDDALALERLVRHRGTAVQVEGVDAPAPDVLLSMSTGEVLRLGLISNRGLLVLLGAWAASVQFSPRLVENLFESWGKALFGWASDHHFGLQQYAIAAVTLALAFLLLMRLLSIAIALMQYHGFRLTEQARRLTVERGLLARFRSSASRRRLQAWTLHEGVLHRWFGRRSLHVDTAGGAAGGVHVQAAPPAAGMDAARRRAASLVRAAQPARGHRRRRRGRARPEVARAARDRADRDTAGVRCADRTPVAARRGMVCARMAAAAPAHRVAPVPAGHDVPAAACRGAVLARRTDRPGRIVAAALECVRSTPPRAPRGLCDQRRPGRRARRLVGAPLALRRTRQAAGAAPDARAAGSSLGHGDVVARYGGRIGDIDAAAHPAHSRSRSTRIARAPRTHARVAPAALVRVQAPRTSSRHNAS